MVIFQRQFQLGCRSIYADEVGAIPDTRIPPDGPPDLTSVHAAALVIVTGWNEILIDLRHQNDVVVYLEFVDT